MRSILKGMIVMLAIAIATFSADARRQRHSLKPISSTTSAVGPDFSFPKRVITESDAALKTALAKKNGPAIVRAFMDKSLAMDAIDNDSLQSALAELDSLTRVVTGDDTRAMLTLLRAYILNSAYQSQRYKYDNRNLPLRPYPTDYREWSGRQFTDSITTLIADVQSRSKAMKKATTADWASVITLPAGNGRVFYPTLFDFAAWQSIEILKRGDEYVPLSLLFNGIDTYPYLKPATSTILKIFDDLIEFHRDDTPSRLLATTAKASFVSRTDDRSRATIEDYLYDLYQKNAGSEFSSLVIEAISDITMSEGDITPSRRHRLYETAKAYLDNHPSSSSRPCIANIMADLGAKRVFVSFNETVKPGSQLAIKVESENVNSLALKIYKVDNNRAVAARFNRSIINGAKPVATLSVTTDSVVPFKDVQTVMFTVPEEGTYVVDPTFDGASKERDRNLTPFYATLVNGFSTRLDKSSLWVVNPVDGHPLNRAMIDAVSYQRSSAALVTEAGLTDANGHFTPKDNNNYIASSGNSSSPIINTYNTSTNSDQISENGFISTSLPLYHQGDSVEWAVIAYSIEGQQRKAIDNRRLEMTLYDANGQKVESTTVTTDAFGRAAGAMKLPVAGLTGRFRLEARNADSHKNDINFYCSRYFTVSDYKLPTFALTSLTAMRDTPSRGDVTLKGRAVAYSGFPISGASIEMALSAGGRWIYSPFTTYYSTSATTDADGSFTIVLPASLLDNAPGNGFIFKADVTATSPTGESQSDVIRFSPKGGAYTIVASLPGNIDVTKPVKLNITVNNPEGKTVDSLIDYTLTDMAGREIITGEQLNTPKPTVDWSGIPSGRYKMTVALPDTTLAEKTVSEIVIYRPDDKKSPVDDALWMPRGEITVDRGKKAEILYATAAPSSSLLLTTSASGKIIDQKWIKVDAGMHRLAIDVPADLATLDVNLSGIVNYSGVNADCKIVVDKALPQVTITTESFRDKLTPGTNETWTFKVTDQNGDGIKAAMMIDMYNTALSSIAKGGWTMPDFMQPYIRHFNSNVNRFTPTRSVFLSSNIKRLDCNDTGWPRFETYNRTWGRGQIHIRGMYYATAARDLNSAPLKSMKAEMKSEAVVADEVAEVTEETLDTGGAAPGATPENGNDSDSPAAFSYRDSEVALALFKPSMTTDNEGNATLTFTVPNANTRWKVNTFAYTDDMTSASIVREMTASKPVMVQPNLPRFLRMGDRATIKAAVMNNSDDVATITTVIEIFDPVTGKIIDTATSTATLEAKADTTASIVVTAPSASSMIGLRVKSSTTTFADGEQSIIAVLPSTQPVIETMPFYMAPDSTVYHGEIPARPADSRVTLSFCENPVWDVVTALPGLLKGDALTAPGAVEAIFSAAVAEGIMRDNPAIATELHRWLTTDRSDSTLVSMLERNADLKTFVLTATPWVQAAESDTERMTRLALLFDRKALENVFETNITLLKKLQSPAGGLLWMAQCDEPSQWATARVLSLLGELSAAGHLPKDKRLKPLMTSALTWLDNEVVKDHHRYPDGDYTTWTYIHTLYPDASTTASARRIIASTVQRLVGDWKDLDVPDKAIAAIILNSNGYSSTARQVLESLRQYAVYTPERGMHWPSLDNLGYFSTFTKVSATAAALDAFHRVDPSSADIDRIRQWLILEKQAQDWGSSTATTATIAAILESSPRFISVAKGATITVGGKEVERNSLQRATGSFNAVITDLTPAVGGEFKVVRPGDSPSWGSIYIQYIGDMADIKASACDDVSIEKQLYLLKGDGEGISATDASALKVGDKVKVELVIKTGRDIDYVAIENRRPACFEPVEQLPRPIWSEGICFYRENRDAATNIFVTRLPKGVYRLSYEMVVNNAGNFTSGLATLQSQYCPALSAHSSGSTITVADDK